MTDVFDRAQEREAELRQDAIDRVLRSAHELSGESALHCESCGLEIPEKRRIAVPGVKTCVECQNDIERLGAQSKGER